ncbi:hypothetical protein R3P38DRAFT_3188895 [Favolaschia claudopus]|uniref:Uncharacterized protein n=1 Tax=Favolaschia claudopus TaxID=2862362 RepID=A0AAW0BSU9_9AGAR
MALAAGQWQTPAHTAFISRWVAVYEPFRTGNNLPLYWETMYDAYFEEFSSEIDLTMLVSQISRSVLRKRRRLYNSVMREVYLAREPSDPAAPPSYAHTPTMPPTSWTTNLQRQFLEAWYPVYVHERAHARLRVFWNVLFTHWFHEFPLEAGALEDEDARMIAHQQIELEMRRIRAAMRRRMPGVAAQGDAGRRQILPINFYK